MPDAFDRIDIRTHQIEALRELIAWEEMHDWGDAADLGPLSATMIKHYRAAIATLENIVLLLASDQPRTRSQ